MPPPRTQPSSTISREPRAATLKLVPQQFRPFVSGDEGADGELRLARTFPEISSATPAQQREGAGGGEHRRHEAGRLPRVGMRLGGVLFAPLPQRRDQTR